MNGSTRLLLIIIFAASLLVGCGSGSNNSASMTKRDHDRLQIELLDVQKTQAAMGDENTKIKGDLDAANAKVASLTAELKQAQDARMAAQGNADQRTSDVRVQEQLCATLKLERDSLRQQLSDAESSTNAAKAEASAYRNQLDAIYGKGGNSKLTIDDLKARNSELQRKIDALEAAAKQPTTRPATAESMNK